MSKKGQGGKGKQSKTQRLEAQERKRDERVMRNAHRKKKKDESYLADDDNFAGFATQLQTMGLELRDVPGDGNCLFRALGDQLEGHSRNHLRHRHETVQYMQDHRDNFEPFVEDDVPFDRHVENLGKSGTYAGNDSIVAFARKNKVNIVIHQLNNPVWKITGCDVPGTKELHISYHNGDHYSSVRKSGDKSVNPTNFKADSGQGASSSTSNANSHHKDRHKKKKDKPCQDSSNTGASASYFQDSGVGASGGLCNGGTEYEAMNDMEIEVLQTTGCQDLNLIRDSLEDNCYDVEATVDFILQVTAAANQIRGSLNEQALPSDTTQSHPAGATGGADSGTASLWSSKGTGTRIFGPQVDTKEENTATNSNKTEPNRTNKKQNHRPNNRQLKQQKKLEKKQRQMERHQQKVIGESASPTSTAADDNDDFNPVPVNEMGALHI